MILRSNAARICDGAMCLMMDLVQRRHRLDLQSPRHLRLYIEKHESQLREDYFKAPIASPGDVCLFMQQRTRLRWLSAVITPWVENNYATVDFYLGPRGPQAPTVLMLHALMSASDFGYRRWAARFNARGWNVCFLHLPYHYSRRPTGRMSGELAVTADLVRTAQGLRQGVAEIRQLLGYLRAQGCCEFGMWATSYGAWIGALLLSVEAGFRWAAMMAPIADVEHIIWHSPAGSATRRELSRVGITPALVARHFPLASPLHARPKDDALRPWIVVGEYDRVTPPATGTRLHQAWTGSELVPCAQGHFGYRMMNELWPRVEAVL
jgi:pimeloyl-ACP methyl ester carboxylesterase